MLLHMLIQVPVNSGMDIVGLKQGYPYNLMLGIIMQGSKSHLPSEDDTL